MSVSAKWTECSLGDVLTLKRGYDLPKRQRMPGAVPIVSSSGVSGFHNVAKVKGPGVVTGRYGTLGEVFYLPVDFWPLNTSLYVRDFKGNDPLFVSYFLRTLPFASQNVAGAVPGVNRNFLHMLNVRLPRSAAYQRKIASILSAYDDLIENNLRRIQILEEMAQALYREWFVEFRFPGHGAIKRTKSPVGMVPSSWPVCRASDAMEIDPKPGKLDVGEKPFLPMASLSASSLLIGEIEVRTGKSGSKFRNGDTLFARITPCLENGKIGFVQFLPADDVVGLGSTEFIVLRSRTLSPEIVYLLARSSDFRQNAIKSMSGASGRQRVQKPCFDKYLLAQPDEQTIRSFTALARPIFRAEHLLAEKNRVLRETRDLLLPKLIAGELDVSGLDVEVGEAA